MPVVSRPPRTRLWRLVALLALLLVAPAALAQSAVFGPGLQQTLDALSPLQTTTVVVTFEGDGPLTTAQRGALTALGITRGVTFRSLPIAGVVATKAQVEAIARRSDVVSIWPNSQLTYSNADATELTGVDAARTDDSFRRLNGGLPVSGNGVGVVVNDSGVDGLHPDVEYGRNLVQNVIGSTNLNAYVGLLPITYVEGQPSTDTNSGHGTHVAATVGGTGAASGGLHEGVAPGADLVGYGSGGVLLVLDGIGGLDYALTNQARYGVRVVTNSWGSSGAFDPADPIVQATYRLYQRGITVLFAAGNEGPSADTHNPYARAPWVISVAAGNKDGATLAGFSSRGVDGETTSFTTPDGRAWTARNEPTLTAPGVDIVSACAAGSPLCALGIQPDNAFYTQMSGTSMATPHVAGVVALMLEADPTLQPDDVRRILTETATPMDYAAWEAGAGYVNAYAAVAAALGLDPAPYLKAPAGDDGPALPAGVVLADAEGDATMAGTDLVRASVFEEDPTRFQVTLDVADLEQATPSTLLLAGLQVGAMQEYSVEFDLAKAGAPTVRYTLSAKRTLVSAGTEGAALDAPSFDFGVRAADGSGRGIEDMPGIWDVEAGTITWILTTDQLNVAAAPADLTATIDRSGRAAAAGDVLGGFSAAVATSLWGGVVGLTPGQTTYDTAAGTATYTLGEAPAEDGGTDPTPDPETPPADDPHAWKNVRPVLECVATNDDGTATARFGYLNDNALATTLAVGSMNQFAPWPKDRGQPTVFDAGRQRFVFEVDFAERHLVWKLGRRTATAGSKSPACPDPQPQVVVSVIDSGINPYHAFFNAGSEIYADAAPSAVTAEVREQFGIDEAHTLRLTRTGDFAADFAADAAQWAKVQPGEVYWFEGTNVLAVSFDPGSRILLPDDEGDTHGVGTSAAVLRANPEAVVLFVEGITDESETFAFTHPSVDLVSTSYGAIGSLPLPFHINNSYVGVVENGKLHLGAADNSPSTAVQDGTAGPWWSIGVAGFEEGTSEGKQLLSGSLPDFVGDFTQTLPYCAECEDGQQSVSGTSFATPLSAGTISKVILDARREAGHLGGIQDVDGTPTMIARPNDPVTNWEVRRAFEEAAYVPTVSEYDPVEGAFDFLGLPVPPAAPYALVGWGAITPDPVHGVVAEALAQLGVGGATPARAKTADTCTFMTSVVTARHVYWDNLAIESESFMIGGEDPYVYCGGGALLADALSGALLAEAAPAFELAPNRPNPFSGSTQVSFSVPEAGPVRLAVYDLLGREVNVLVDETREAGTYGVTLRADGLATGTYVLRLEAAGQAATRTMTLAR